MKKPTSAPDTPADVPAVPRFEDLEHPRTGGSYLRDPVTGALTPNPAEERQAPAPETETPE